jgi:nucleotide-binding universal stress UspA family protein
VRRLALSESKSYFTFVTVVPQADWEQARQQGKRAPDLVNQLAMRNWAQPLRLPEARMVFQVLPGEPVRTLLGYARRHLVDHIIVGARGSSALRRHLGSISAAVAAQAPCTVTVVRTRKDTGKSK